MATRALLVVALAAAADPAREAPDAGTTTSGNSGVPVSGVVTRVHETHPCFGGAAVTEDIIQRETTALGRQALTVFKGRNLTGKIAARLKTDASGRFTTRLAPGVYCVVLGEVDRQPAAKPASEPLPEPMSAATTNGNYDPVCMEQLKHPVPKCDAELHVPERGPGRYDVELYSSNQCTQQWAHPCWRGPMPP